MLNGKTICLKVRERKRERHVSTTSQGRCCQCTGRATASTRLPHVITKKLNIPFSLLLTLLFTSTTLSLCFNGVRCCCCLDILLPGWLAGWGTADKTIHRNYGCCFPPLRREREKWFKTKPCFQLSVILCFSTKVGLTPVVVSRAVLCQLALLSFSYDTDKKSACGRWIPVNPVWDLSCECNSSCFSSSNLTGLENTTRGVTWRLT